MPAATPIAHCLGLPIGFLAPVLVPAFSLRVAILTLLFVSIVNTALTLVLTPLCGNTLAYLMVVAAALFTDCRAQDLP